MRAFLVAAAIAVAAVSPANAQQGGALPPGEGRDIVAVACTQCHAPSAFAQLRQGAEAWRHQVYDMILRGAQINPAEVEPAVGYLTASFGPGINLPPSRPVTLPDGRGKDVVEAQCGVCHGLDRIAMSKRSPAEWNMVLNRMRFLGATTSAEDQKTIAAYLGEKFAK